MKVSYYNIDKEFNRIKLKFRKSLENIGKSGNFILGNFLYLFEKKLKKTIGSKHVIGVSNGTDALELAISALNIPPRSEIISVSNTFISSINSIIRSGCVPVLCDIDETYNINPVKIEQLITKKTKAIMVVHLNGMPSCLYEINKIAKKYNLKVIEDCAQSILSKYNNLFIGNSNNLCCFSMHPTKNFGGIMDGGFISTNNSQLAKKIKIMRNHGLKERGIVNYVGQNSRLSEINASALLLKHKYLKKDTLYKIKLAKVYDNLLDNAHVITPKYGCCRNIVHTFHRYVIRVKKREDLKKYLIKKGIETKIHYEKNIHEQNSLKKYLKIPKKLVNTNKYSLQTLSLPINQFLNTNQIKYVCRSINDFYNKNS